VAHTLWQLRGGIVDFCYVLDQAFTGFMWNWVYFPKFSAVTVKPDKGVMCPDEVMGLVKNATIESSLISLRVLDEFFAETTIREGDIRSHDYDGYSSPGRFLKREEYDSIGRRVAHLTIEHSSREPWKITELIWRCCEPSENFLTFIVEGAGKQYMPDKFDVASTLKVCRGMDGYMQKVLHEEAKEKDRPLLNRMDG
jgi:hypothetical protein